MQKRKSISIILVAILIIIAIIYYFTPKTFGQVINPSDIDHINVFDGNTGVGFTIDNPEDIKYIVENIQSKSMRRSGISIGRVGYLFSITYVDSNDKAIVSTFFINGEDTIRKDPFFYRCDGGLCVDYLEELENKLGD
jgi:hypothetical protein